MSDLDARIRVQLAGWRLNVESLREHGMDLIALDALMQAQAAILAVLDRHKPQRLDDEHDPYCAECSGLHGVTVTYPCRTARDIAKELGVEVDDA